MISSFVVDSIIILFIIVNQMTLHLIVVGHCYVDSMSHRWTTNMWNVLLLETKLLECSFCPTFSFILLFLNIIFRDAFCSPCTASSSAIRRISSTILSSVSISNFIYFVQSFGLRPVTCTLTLVSDNKSLSAAMLSCNSMRGGGELRSPLLCFFRRNMVNDELSSFFLFEGFDKCS